jgi:hypothetical protein
LLVTLMLPPTNSTNSFVIDKPDPTSKTFSDHMSKQQ